ncbi:AEC family transporter [Sutterella megalosphaeroides]|uniref:Malate transporter n=1 Tax=Sutterella megalosphaeroides TaxID=2494234 RepID=A0A2Z6IA75_9BURK|nr:AEC family transporter [Sutterella megalosphaeroides]BBF22800.1 hypothetical protein SUTMEG_06910 [Sutterella megalosphaeroides]
MLEALQSSLANVLILLLVSACGWWAARRGTFGEKERAAAAKIVTFTLPFFLFHSVVSKFSHEALIELLQTAFVPFVTVGINTAISLLLIRFGLVRREVRGAFVASFTGSTVLFVGVPLTTALYGPEGIPYLLVYFFANLVFIWTAGLYAVKLDGVAARGGPKPALVSPESLRMLLSPPFLAFLAGLFAVAVPIPVPDVVAGTTRTIGAITSPLALLFIGIVVHRVGLEPFKHLPLELKLVLASCFIIRPLVMYLVTMPLDMDEMMRRVFVTSSAMPVSSVIAVLCRSAGADDAFVSEAVGVTTIGLVAALPLLWAIANFA